MPVHIKESPVLDLECDECPWTSEGFALRSDAEAAAFAHEESHSGFFPEGEDA